MKKVFKVGDKVRMIGHSSGAARVDGLKGTVSLDYENEYLEVVAKNGRSYDVLSSQCRLLVKKPKQEVYITQPIVDRLAKSGNVNAYISDSRVVPTDVRFIRAKDQKRGK